MSQDEKQPELIYIGGVVKANGDKIKFVDDGGGKSWEVLNAETLKRRRPSVELSPHLYKDKGQFQVISITMLESSSLGASSLRSAIYRNIRCLHAIRQVAARPRTCRHHTRC
jgi:hypothetical protein